MNLNALANGKGAATESEDRLGSPTWLVDHLQQLFGKFTCDLASEAWSAVATRFVTEQMDLFKQLELRTAHGYLNAPYGKGQLMRFVPFVRDALVLSGRVPALTMLLPHYTADGWWQSVTKPQGRVKKCEWRYGLAGHERLKNWTRLTSEGLVIDLLPVKGRLKHRYPPHYKGKRSISPFSSVVARFSLP